MKIDKNYNISFLVAIKKRKGYKFCLGDDGFTHKLFDFLPFTHKKDIERNWRFEKNVSVKNQTHICQHYTY